jgi:hypothetical protein
MAYISDSQYYNNNNVAPTDQNWGSYQYVPLSDIVNNFMLINVGDDKSIGNAKRYEVLFHAKRGIQELNYDALRSFKKIEINLGNSLKLVMPPDYVNYVRISININGVLYPMAENRQTLSAVAYLQDSNNNILFDSNGNVLTGTSALEIQTGQMQQYFGPGQYSGCWGWCYDGSWYFSYNVGGRYGLDPEIANENPTFTVNKEAGVIDFSSGARNHLIVIEYVSDGLEKGDDENVSIHKMAEVFIYAYIKWAILNNKFGIQEYVIKRAKDEKAKELRNIKLRLSNLHPSRLTMALRGRGKIIK